MEEDKLDEEPFGWYVEKKAKKDTATIHPGFAEGLIEGEVYEDFLREEPEEDEFFEIVEEKPLYSESQVEDMLLSVSELDRY